MSSLSSRGLGHDPDAGHRAPSAPDWHRPLSGIGP